MDEHAIVGTFGSAGDVFPQLSFILQVQKSNHNEPILRSIRLGASYKHLISVLR